MERLELRDSLTATGISSSIMACDESGRVLFKKDNNHLYLFELENIRETEILFKRPSFLYADCEIYHLSFTEEGTVLAILQKPETREFLLCEMELDTIRKETVQIGDIGNTRIRTEDRRQIGVCSDEKGTILVCYPIKFAPNSPTPHVIEVFHCSRYMRDRTGGKIRINCTFNYSTEMLVHNVGVSRNHLYMFDCCNASRCLVTSLVGAQQGKANVLSAKNAPNLPSGAATRRVEFFDEFALVYTTISTSKSARSFGLYMLDLTYFSYRPISLSLSHHAPAGKVSLCKGTENTVYLHGDCNMITCQERHHLYQIDLTSLPKGPAPSRSISNASMISLGSLVSVNGTSPSSGPTPPPRYEKRRGRAEQRKITMKDRTKSLDCLSILTSSSGEDTNGNPRKGSLHWGATMADEGQTTLRDQLRLAKDMGFGDEAIMKALNMNAPEDPEGYSAFENTNTMLDILNEAQNSLSDHPKLRLSLYNGDSKHADRPTSSRNLMAPRSASVSRSSSLNLGTSSQPRNGRNDSHDINRLIATLDKEQERTKREVDMQFTILKERIRHLETQLQKETSEKDKAEEREIQTLNRLKDEGDNLRVEREENEKLRRTLNENRGKIDELTIENLRLHKELSDQKELSTHRKRQYDTELESRMKEINDLKQERDERAVEIERIRTLEDENERLRDTIRSHSSSSTCLEREKFEAVIERDELKEKLGLIESQVTKCCICLEDKPSIVFFSCLHVCICEGCFSRESIDKCPTCRAKIVGHSKIFF